DNAMRMMYGNPLGSGFMIWGWWDTSGSTPPAQMIVTSNSAGNYSLTSLGQKWVDLMNEFSTPTQNALTDSNGAVIFNGFYGEYALKVGGVTYATVNFEKGANNTPMETLWVKGDFNLDGKLTNADLQSMLNALKNLTNYQSSHGMLNQEFNAICDVNGDGSVSTSDLLPLMNLLASGIQAGDGIFGGSELATVPEPASILLGAISFGLLLVEARRIRRR